MKKRIFEGREEIFVEAYNVYMRSNCLNAVMFLRDRGIFISQPTLLKYFREAGLQTFTLRDRFVQKRPPRQILQQAYIIYASNNNNGRRGAVEFIRSKGYNVSISTMMKWFKACGYQLKRNNIPRVNVNNEEEVM